MGALALPAMEVMVLDTVSGRDLLMPKPGVLLDTDTVPDMVLEDMEVTVLALPAMEVTVLDTVSGRDLLTPGWTQIWRLWWIQPWIWRLWWIRIWWIPWKEICRCLVRTWIWWIRRIRIRWICIRKVNSVSQCPCYHLS